MQEKGTANREAPTKVAPTTQREGGSEHSPPPQASSGYEAERSRTFSVQTEPPTTGARSVTGLKAQVGLPRHHGGRHQGREAHATHGEQSANTCPERAQGNKQGLGRGGEANLLLN